jgi:GMP synthase-like glutamine amidotransferase
VTQKILLIDLCYERDSLSRYEFVLPIANALDRAGVQCNIAHFMDVRDVPKDYDKIILCGTALKDNAYADHIAAFSWIKQWDGPIMGICAGMQVIGALFGGRIFSRPSIGLEKINIVLETPLLGKPGEIEGYHLHNYSVALPQEFLPIAKTAEGMDAFKHCKRPIYGIMFHPEVRNRWILGRFANL